MFLLFVCLINKGNVLYICKIDKVGNIKVFFLIYLILLLILICIYNNFYLYVMCFSILKFVILYVRNILILFSVNVRGRCKCCLGYMFRDVLFYCFVDIY